jgi:hypothetical protein
LPVLPVTKPGKREDTGADDAHKAAKARRALLSMRALLRLAHPLAHVVEGLAAEGPAVPARILEEDNR